MAARENYHLRELPSMVFQEQTIPDDFREFATERVLPQIPFAGYKLIEKKAIAIQCLHQLVRCGLVGKAVADSRQKTQPGVRLRAEVWDQIAAAGLASVCLGSEETGRTTRYYPTPKLLELKRCWELRFITDLDLARNSQVGPGGAPVPLALVVLHSGKIDLGTGVLLPEEQRKVPIHFLDEVQRLAQRGPDGEPDPRAVANGMRYWQAVEDVINRINDAATSHSWQATAVDPVSGRQWTFQPNPCLRQLHIGAFFRGARLYGWSDWAVQRLPRTVRQTIRIDGDPVAELDFSGMATRMLYHMAGHDPDPAHDVYRPERILPQLYGFENMSADRRMLVRDFIKRATNICWNVAGRGAANSAVGHLLAEHGEDSFLRKAIYRVERTDPAGIVERIMAAHTPLADRFFTEAGMELMTADGKIMLGILNEFAKAGRAATGIHDAVLCRAADAEFATETMADIYRRHLNFHPVIHRSY